MSIMSWEKVDLPAESNDEYNNVKLTFQFCRDSEERKAFVKIDQVSLEKFNFNDMPYTKWSAIYVEEARKKKWTDPEIIENLMLFMDEDLRLLIKLLPEEDCWEAYNNRIKKLFEDQSKKLIEKKKYYEYKNFFEFFCDKLGMLDQDLNEEAKRELIFQLMDCRFKDALTQINFNEMNLITFFLTCIDLEKKFDWHCERCNSSTHCSSDCKKIHATKGLIQKSWSSLRCYFKNRKGSIELFSDAFLLPIVIFAMYIFLIWIHCPPASINQEGTETVKYELTLDSFKEFVAQMNFLKFFTEFSYLETKKG